VATAGGLVAGRQEGGMKTTVTWQDVGSPTEPGLYEFDDGVLYVKQRELDVWKEHPNALFTVSPIRPYVGPVRYVLGTYELPVEN
jgi:hypothetical protein